MKEIIYKNLSIDNPQRFSSEMKAAEGYTIIDAIMDKNDNLCIVMERDSRKSVDSEGNKFLLNTFDASKNDLIDGMLNASLKKYDIVGTYPSRSSNSISFLLEKKKRD